MKTALVRLHVCNGSIERSVMAWRGNVVVHKFMTRSQVICIVRCPLCTATASRARQRSCSLSLVRRVSRRMLMRMRIKLHVQHYARNCGSTPVFLVCLCVCRPHNCCASRERDRWKEKEKSVHDIPFLLRRGSRENTNASSKLCLCFVHMYTNLHRTYSKHVSFSKPFDHQLIAHLTTVCYVTQKTGTCICKLESFAEYVMYVYSSERDICLYTKLYTQLYSLS